MSESSATLEVARLRTELALVKGELERTERLINSPQLYHFAVAVRLEAAHQRQRWGSEHDEGKTPFDWFWLLGYLSQKAAAAAVAGDTAKALHHTISTAAALANWHAALLGDDTSMRPGIEPPFNDRDLCGGCGRPFGTSDAASPCMPGLCFFRAKDAADRARGGDGSTAPPGAPYGTGSR